MAVKFTKKASDAEFSLVAYLNNFTSRVVTPRPLFALNASEVTKEDPQYCPRERVLKHLNDFKQKDGVLGSSLALTFDIGEAYSDLIRSTYLKRLAFGDWVCRYCGQEHKLSKVPEVCTKCGNSVFSYKELRFTHKESKITCGIDLIIKVKDTFHIVEIKSISKDDYAKLEAPLAEHRTRTVLYLDILANALEPTAKMVDTSKAFILYVSKGFGTKALGGFSAYKEFIVTPNDADVSIYHDMAKSILLFKKYGVVPTGICDTPFCTRSRNCDMRKQCWGE